MGVTVATAELVEMGVSAIQRVQIGPKDVIVLRCKDHLSREASERIRDQVLAVWPENKVVVLDRDITMIVTHE